MFLKGLVSIENGISVWMKEKWKNKLVETTLTKERCPFKLHVVWSTRCVKIYQRFTVNVFGSKHFCRYGNYFFQAFNFSLYYYFPIETWKEPNKTLEAVCPCWEIIFNQPVDWTIFCEDTRLLRTILVIGTIKLEWIYIFVIWKCTRP